MIKKLNAIPYLGVGIGLRREIAEETLAHPNEIDVLEIISDSYISDFDIAASYFEKLQKSFFIIPHGIRLSIGSDLPLDTGYLEKLKKLITICGAHYYSEHFSLTHMNEKVNIGHLSPIWFTEENLAVVIKKVNAIQTYLGVPLVLENITSSFTIPEADFSEAEFISIVCKETHCGILLDLTNVHINAYNTKQNPIAFLEQLPLEHVVQIHLAGGKLHHGQFIDTHSEEIRGINEGVWNLLAWIIQHANIKAFILERDSNFKDNFEDMVLSDLARARTIVEDARKRNRSITI